MTWLGDTSQVIKETPVHYRDEEKSCRIPEGLSEG